jgi:hypothetical protein
MTFCRLRDFLQPSNFSPIIDGDLTINFLDLTSGKSITAIVNASTRNLAGADEQQ